MNKLPFEISRNIFTLLHQQDKVECMTVCGKWAQIIDSSCLFHTLLLTKQVKMKEVTEILRQKPQKAAQVKYLIIKLDNYNSFCLNSLTLILPNLRFFFIGSVSTAFEETKPVIQPWKNYIDHLIILSAPSLGDKLLTTNKFIRLSRLDLNANNIPESKLLNMLLNVPNVSQLGLNSVKLTIDGFELLHTALPLLKSLSLSFSKLISGLLPQNVLPATSVKEYRVVLFNEDVRNQIVWLQYISRKYPSLSVLDIVNHSTQVREEDRNYIDSLGLLSSDNNTSKNRLRGCGSQLKRLTLNTSILPSNFFECLDYTGIQLQYLKLSSGNIFRMIDSMKLSRQLKSIETLSLGELYPLDLKWMKTQMPIIKSLTLKLTVTSYQINTILDMCPDTLEALELHCDRHYLLVGSLVSSYSIKSLTIKDAYLPEVLDTFISNYLPQLDTLKFDNCYFKEKKITLPNHHLSCFKVQTSILVITSKDNKETIYKSCHDSDVLNLVNMYTNGEVVPLYPYSKPIEYDSCKSRFYFVLTCASVQNVITM